jgi:hypothetical protein
MDKVISLHTVVFEFAGNGEQLYCSVRKEDLDRFGEKCAFMHEVIQGVSDEPDEAVEDFINICNLILSGGGTIGPTVVKQVMIH